jgi:RHS repeat-associated protein
MGGIQCRSFTERVWWDGDQALVEERTPEGTSDVSNSGLVGNIHGLTLDEPLAVMSDQTRIVNYNWRGQGESSVFPNGQAGDASLGNSATEIDWPALTQAQTYFTPGPGSGGGSNPKRWMGTFVANGQGTTGMLYRRNRYFSPVSGQFTQSDPIGIAGGMNAYGFASGDPVNYSDPFGFCTRADGWTNCITGGALHYWGATANVSGSIAGAFGARTMQGLALFGEVVLDVVGEAISDATGWGDCPPKMSCAIVPFGGAFEPAPSIGGIKGALSEVHGEVGKLPKGEAGKFGSPQRGTSVKGYRLDPGHARAPIGSVESRPHINWWDWTAGKRGTGGRSGAVPIKEP